MGIIVKQFDGNSVTPKDDAVVMDLLFSSHGIFDGCGISFLGANQLMVNSGRMIIKGRQVVITEETIAAQLSSGGTKRGRLYIRIDLSSPTTPAEFLTQVADTLPELTQEEDANYNDGIYEVELCNYDVSEVAISNIVESCPIISGGMDMLRTLEEVMANTEYGKGVDAQAIKELNNNFANQFSELNNAIDNCFQSVSNGKALVASAITGKGVTTASDATFETMATNIKNIVTSASIKSCTAIGLRQSLTGATVGAYYLVMVTSQDAFATVTGGATVITRLNTDPTSYSGWYMTLCIVKATNTTITAGGTQYNYWAKINL